MELVISLFTLVLVLNSLFLMLLILVQLPKKEAGAGLAFGGGASDALFGAGSGTALTRITKYATGIFLGLSVLLSVMRTHHANTTGRTIAREIERKAAAAAAAATAAGGSTNLTLPLLPTLFSNSPLGMPKPVATNAVAPGPAPTNRPTPEAPGK